jgi:uncharacterized surface protein with fasciclin (FAS1) repeats
MTSPPPFASYANMHARGDIDAAVRTTSLGSRDCLAVLDQSNGVIHVVDEVLPPK